MTRFIVLLSLLAIAHTLCGQTVSVQYQLDGVVDARTLGSVTICDPKSKPTVMPVGIVEVPAGVTEANVQAFSLPQGEVVTLPAISPTAWILDKPGRWMVVVSGAGVKIPIHAIDIGGITPPPVPPGPGPPSPRPVPDPVPNILDEYHVGLVAFQNAPKDQQLAIWIADLYRGGANKLFGQGGLSDIRSIMTDISNRFANRQCSNQAICEQWARWKTTVDAALIAEQKKRGTFSREDWFSSLYEIAKALEAVK